MQFKLQLRELDLATGFVVSYSMCGQACMDAVGTVPHYSDGDWTWIARNTPTPVEKTGNRVVGQEVGENRLDRICFFSHLRKVDLREES